MVTNKQELINKKGQKVDREFINEIITHFYISKKALKEMREKTSYVNLVSTTNETFRDGTPIIDFKDTIFNIRHSIAKYKQAYIDNEGDVKITLGDFVYFIFEFDDYRGWVLIDFKEDGK